MEGPGLRVQGSGFRVHSPATCRFTYGIGLIFQGSGYLLRLGFGTGCGVGVGVAVQRFRGGLVFKAHGLCVLLNSGLEGNKEEEEENGFGFEVGTWTSRASTALDRMGVWCMAPNPHPHTPTPLGWGLRTAPADLPRSSCAGGSAV